MTEQPTQPIPAVTRVASLDAPEVRDALRILNLHHLAGQVAQHGVPMHGAPAVGMPLHTNGHLGADLVHVAAGAQFPVHTHPGDHLLLSIGGLGTITVADVTYRVEPGDIYMVDGDVPHAVGADPDSHHILVAIGAPHKEVDSPERMAFTDWLGRPVATPLVPSSVPEAQRASAVAAALAAVKTT